MVCAIEDLPAIVEGQVDAMGRQRYEHTVTIELRYLKDEKDLTPYLKSKGWSYKLHQARPAMERFICRPCLNATALMERDWRKKRDGERRANTETFYGELCS